MDFRQLLVLAVLNELVPPSSVGSLPVETQCGDYTAGGRSLWKRRSSPFFSRLCRQRNRRKAWRPKCIRTGVSAFRNGGVRFPRGLGFSTLFEIRRTASSSSRSNAESCISNSSWCITESPRSVLVRRSSRYRDDCDHGTDSSIESATGSEGSYPKRPDRERHLLTSVGKTPNYTGPSGIVHHIDSETGKTDVDRHMRVIRNP